MGPAFQIGQETLITVDAKAAGKGKVTCKVSTPDGAELDVDVVENHDGTFDIYYTAPEPGKYVITIRFGGVNIPKSPFHVAVSSSCPVALWVSCITEVVRTSALVCFNCSQAHMCCYRWLVCCNMLISHGRLRFDQPDNGRG